MALLRDLEIFNPLWGKLNQICIATKPLVTGAKILIYVDMQVLNREKMPIKVAFEHLRSIGRVHTQKDVGEAMNVGKENISRAFNGVDGYYTPGFVRRFNETFGNIFNEDFLLNGEGDMLRVSNDKEERKEQSIDKESNEFETYLLPQSAMGGTLAGFPADGTALQNCEKVISPICGVDFAITVYGESMAPEYPSGSRVLIKKVNPEVFIDWGKAYVLDTSNGVIIKEVMESAKEGCIRCHSINPDPKFSDFDVPMSEIYGIYRVLMCLSAK